MKNGKLTVIEMKTPNSIVGIATIKDGTIIPHSHEVEELLTEIGVAWIQQVNTATTIQLTDVIRVHIYSKRQSYIAVFEDLSEWKELQQKIFDLEMIFNHSHDGLYYTDGNGVTLGVNRGMERNYDVKATDLIGRNVRDLEEEGIFKPSVARLALEKRRRVTAYQKTKKGKILIVTGNPIFDDGGNIIRVVCNNRDVTELIQLKEQIKQKDEIVERYERELIELRMKQTETEGMITKSKKMKDILSQVKRVAPFDSTILITGESGTGKGVLAKKIHQLSSKKFGPFIKVDCGAIPESLLESELFGYEHGAFTGARKGGKPGYFELAHTGTLFLDEIGELPLSLQSKLLQAIQDKTIKRIGGTRAIDVDVRLIAATNRNLEQMVIDGMFREDLYYRLNVVPIEIPPLRERKEDIPYLIHYFLDKFNNKYRMHKRLDEDSLLYLCRYHWPGNVRQLQNIIERLVVLSDKDMIDKEIVLKLFHSKLNDNKGNALTNKMNETMVQSSKEPIDLKSILKEIEKKYIIDALKKYKSTRKAAKYLSMSQPTLVRRMKEYQILLNQN